MILIDNNYWFVLSSLILTQTNESKMDVQQDLFNNSPIDLLKEEMRMEIRVVKERSDNVRRGLFARHNEIVKEQQNLRKELDEMKAYVMGMEKAG